MEQLYSTSSLLALLPTLEATVPYVGTINATPYVAAGLLFLIVSIVFKIVQVVVVSRLQVFSTKTTTDIDDVVIGAVQGIRAWVYTLVALYLSLQLLAIPSWLDTAVSGLVYFALAWQAIEIILKFVAYGTARFLEKDEDGDGVVDPNSATASEVVTLLARIGLWVLGIIFVLSNLGIEVTSLIAGLGIGGIAIAFALQGILSDLFASFSIYFDKPFRIGDFIIIGTDSGTVEKIGIKSTRIRTLQGEELVVSNAELTTARVQNFKKMQKRRIVANFGITYETPHEKVKSVNGIIKRIFDSIEGANLDRVHFTTFGDSALQFELVYFVMSSDYAEYLNIQQQFSYDLMDVFAEVGIEFAYPTQTIYTKAIEK